ncbi:serine/threonine-protein kinase 17B-like [Acanthaster planci]|uniref:non-specific serine/threonine protein kinase n=1 Tax=Acanthaster planci TaxID=133434 RepID=A0A8B7YU76_ACAPL|nr:serine/threonine-protein kinase 17B-like [Acanthaster planci]
MPLRELAMNSRVVTRDVTARFREGDFHASYTVQNELGRGRFAVVRKCTCVSSSRDFAAKFVRKRKMGRSCREDILKEIRILEMSTDHPRMIRLHEVFETASEVILVLEFAAGGELHPYCVAEKEDAFTEQDVVRLVRQILEGVYYLHQNNIVHLDLKPQNILLTSGLPCLGDIKLIDFGIARLVQNGDVIRDIVGTPEFVAPEVLNYEPITLATDMWSIGVLTYVMLTGISPFAGDDKQETFLNISQVSLDFPQEYFQDISEDAQDFIRRVCVKEPEKRLTAEECLNHRWLHASCKAMTTLTTSGNRVSEDNNNQLKEDVDQDEDVADQCCADDPETTSFPCDTPDSFISRRNSSPEVLPATCNHSTAQTFTTTTTVTVRTVPLDFDCTDGGKDSEKRILDSEEDLETTESVATNSDSSEQHEGCRSPYHSPSVNRRVLLKSKDTLPKDLNQPKRICIQVV